MHLVNSIRKGRLPSAAIDHKRDNDFNRHGQWFIKRFTEDECKKNPRKVVQDFLDMLHKFHEDQHYLIRGDSSQLESLIPQSGSDSAEPTKSTFLATCSERPPQLEIQLKLFKEQEYSAQRLVAGVCAIGREALFGPVVAAAVILPTSALPQLAIAGIKDSKLSPLQRIKLAQHIQGLALDWRIGYATSHEIDQLHILQASLLAMKRAILKLKAQPNICLVNGKQPLPNLPLPQQTMVKGDERSLEIAAASIVAKAWRDELVIRLAAKYPDYDLVANKGNKTKRHQLALQQYGPSRLHRISFLSCQVGEST
jgi:ribonuclease HII